MIKRLAALILPIYLTVLVCDAVCLCPSDSEPTPISADGNIADAHGGSASEHTSSEHHRDLPDGDSTDPESCTMVSCNACSLAVARTPSLEVAAALIDDSLRPLSGPSPYRDIYLPPPRLA